MRTDFTRRIVQYVEPDHQPSSSFGDITGQFRQESHPPFGICRGCWLVAAHNHPSRSSSFNLAFFLSAMESELLPEEPQVASHSDGGGIFE